MLILGHHHHLISFSKRAFQSDFSKVIFFSFFLQESAVWSRMHLRHLPPNYEEFGGEKQWRECHASTFSLLLLVHSWSQSFAALLSSAQVERRRRQEAQQKKSVAVAKPRRSHNKVVVLVPPSSSPTSVVCERADLSSVSFFFCIFAFLGCQPYSRGKGFFSWWLSAENLMQIFGQEGKTLLH